MLRRSRSRWLVAALILASGTLFQTSCTALAVDATSGLASSITDQFIHNLIYQALGVGSTLSLGT